MQIITHRGHWTNPGERNTLAAFEQSFVGGMGAEIDVRDFDGALVVSHDPPRARALPFADVLAAHAWHGHPGILAINVKADGLVSMLSVALAGTPRWFAFDMSVPDTLHYAHAGVPYFARQSEHETAPSLYAGAAGVWIDCFERDWFDESLVSNHRRARKAVCLVSPELHGRPYAARWTNWAEWNIRRDDAVSICTDFPGQARERFA